MPTLDPQGLFELGMSLGPLRDRGTLIVGSGFTTHNLRWFNPAGGPDTAPPAASSEFDHWAEEAMARGDVDAILDFLNKAPAAREAHPRSEHWAPLYVALGAAYGSGDIQAKTAIGIPQSVANLSTGSIYNSIARQFDLQSRRDTFAANARISATDNLDFLFGVNTYKRSGNMPYSASFAFNVATELPIVIDNRETDVTVAVEWASHQGMFHMGYQHSKFDQSIPSFTFDNPQFATDYNKDKTTVTGYDPSGYSNGNGPAFGRIQHSAVKYYLCIFGDTKLNARQFRQQWIGEYWRLWLEFSARSIAADAQDPQLKRIILWTYSDFSAVDIPERLGPALGPQWQKISHQTWPIHVHWNWQEAYAIHRREYVRKN
jgi:hypothetical protein